MERFSLESGVVQYAPPSYIFSMSDFHVQLYISHLSGYRPGNLPFIVVRTTVMAFTKNSPAQRLDFLYVSSPEIDRSRSFGHSGASRVAQGCRGGGVGVA